MDYKAANGAWQTSGKPALMSVYRNEGQWDKSNVLFRDGLVKDYDKSHPTADMLWIDYGLGGLTARALDLVGPSESDLAVLQRALALAGLLCGYEVKERFHEIGTPEALAETEAYLRALRMARNRGPFVRPCPCRFMKSPADSAYASGQRGRNPLSRGAIFLDRDGVINELIPDPYSGRPESPLLPEDVRVIPGAAGLEFEASRRGYVLVGVTNQPAAAKELVSVEELLEVHARLVSLLAEPRGRLGRLADLSAPPRRAFARAEHFL